MDKRPKLEEFRVIDADSGLPCRPYELPDVSTGVRPNYAIVQPSGTGPRPKKAFVPPTAAEIMAMQEQARKEAREEGYREGLAAGKERGYQEGFQSGQADAQARVARLDAMLAALAKPLAAIDDDMEGQLTRMCLVLAQNVIRREIKTQAGEIIGVVREALKLLPANSKHIKVVVNPEDAALLREMLVSAQDEAAWALVEDPVLSRGGCEIRTEQSRIDATLEKRLHALVSQFLGDLRDQDEEARND